MISQDILDHLKAHQDKKYKTYQLAVKFKSTANAVRLAILELGDQVEKIVSGNSVSFHYVTEEVRAQKVQRQEEFDRKLLAKKREYKMPQSMIDALARAREGRKDDFGYVTIS